MCTNGWATLTIKWGTPSVPRSSSLRVGAVMLVLGRCCARKGGWGVLTTEGGCGHVGVGPERCCTGRWGGFFVQGAVKGGGAPSRRSVGKNGLGSLWLMLSSGGGRHHVGLRKSGEGCCQRRVYEGCCEQGVGAVAMAHTCAAGWVCSLCRCAPCMKVHPLYVGVLPVCMYAPCV